jgi:hypothetical protein
MDQPEPTNIAKQANATKQSEKYLSDEFIAAREDCWITLADSQHVYVGCGDDRAPTADSAEALGATGILNPMEGYASIYGAAAGLAKNVLVVGVAQFGTSFIAAVGGFDGVIKLLIENSNNPLTLHSAESNEQDAQHFSPDGTAPIGCAYAAGVGATAALLVGSSDSIRTVARVDQKYVFGSDDYFDDLLRGQQAFLDDATGGQGSSFALDRDHYARYIQEFGKALPIMILSGSHCSAKSSGVIGNFSLTQVGNPTKACQQQLAFYRLDIAVIADTVLQALNRPLLAINPDYVLSPELLLRAFLLDATPVRAVLASHDADPDLAGRIDPRNLPLGIRGNPFESLKVLQERQIQGARSHTYLTQR